MTRTPRASLTVTLLNDEDYRTLARAKGGMEAFGVFVAIVVAGRAAFQESRAERLAGTDALRFESRTTHVIDLIGITEAQFKRALATFATVSKETGQKPWLLIEDGRLVIRSFFKFNTKDNWGGSREGAGRKPEKNQLDSSTGDQVGADKESTWRASDAVALTSTSTVAVAAAVVAAPPPGATPPPPYPTDDDLLTIQSGQHDHLPADAERCWSDVWRAFGNLGLCEGWYKAQRRHSLAAWRAAFAEARRREKPIRSIGYVETIARDFDDDGNKRRTASSGNGVFDPDPDAEAKQIAEAAKRRYGGQPNA